MKRKIFTGLFGLMSLTLFSQFKVDVKAPEKFSAKEAILYTLSGSKDVIVGKTIKKNNQWSFSVPQAYTGMLKVYFPEVNASLNMISENKNVDLNFDSDQQKIKQVFYNDASNKLMDQVQEVEQKREIILPALYQMGEYYTQKSDFKTAIDKEINRLNGKMDIDAASHPFVAYYNTNYHKYVLKDPAGKINSQDDLAHFIINSSDYLESSSLLRPILLLFLNSGSKTNVDSAIDKLLLKLNVETTRGQVVLSELIDLFDVYGMSALKEKYLTQAANLKCTITDRLATTLKLNKNTEMGAVFPDYVFQNTLNSNEKSLHQVKAKHKVIVFWSSTCSHCETELPVLYAEYNNLKKMNIEVIAFSLDADKAVYLQKASVFPWVNTSELKGWNSEFVQTYNVHATPTFFILDENNKIVDKPDHVQDVLKYFNLKKAL